MIIGGSMETGSYLLAGVTSGDQTFFSTAHGSGRTLSRTKARKEFRAQTLIDNMAERGIYVRTVSKRGLDARVVAASHGSMSPWHWVQNLTRSRQGGRSA